MSYPLSAEPEVHTWFDDVNHLDLTIAVETWLMELCEEPHPFFAVPVGDEVVPRRYALVPDTDVVITFAVIEDPPVVHLLRIEEATGLWRP